MLLALRVHYYNFPTVRIGLIKFPVKLKSFRPIFRNIPSTRIRKLKYMWLPTFDNHLIELFEFVCAYDVL